MAHEYEIGIMPVVPHPTSFEDRMLQRWGVVFGPVYVVPDDNFIATLEVLGISPARYIAAVRSRFGVDLCSTKPSDACGTGVWS